ncbi:MAG: sulfatase-like hydrolase/transferase [Lentisphaeraceae bacterium]|nr:sulfatase-like hydrolase/transferase [Lentisphaeraceae bacterium]
MKIVLLLFLFCFAVNAADKPNILLIYTDDQSSRTVSCYPEAFDWVETPHIDKLANQGVRFDQAYIGTWCMPSRASMLTGLLQHNVPSLRRVGAYPNAEYDPKKLQFWPKIFKQNGYTTGHIGKWHTGNDTGYGRDWDYQAVWNRPSKSDKGAGTYYLDQRITVNGKNIGNVDGYATDNYTDWAIDFINGKTRPDQKKPWYLWLCLTGVHAPYMPAERHMNDYKNIKVPVPADIYPPRAGKPKYASKEEKWIPNKDGQPKIYQGKGIHGNTLHDLVRQYHQAVKSIDENVGRLMKTLKDSGQLENTLVVFTSDQGFAWGQHGFRHKQAPYAGNIKAPLIISMPGKVAVNKVCQTPVNGVDLVPTFFKLAGLELPWRMDGQDIVSLLKEPETFIDRPLIMTFSKSSFKPETKELPKKMKSIPWYAFVLKGNYKFIQTMVKNEIPELYDLKKDPEELNNLALNPEFKEKVKEYHALMVSELKRTKLQYVDQLPKMKGF